MNRRIKTTDLADSVAAMGCTVKVAATDLVIPFYFFLNLVSTDDGLTDVAVVAGHYRGRVAILKRKDKTATIYFVRFSDDVADVLFGMEN